MSLLALSLFIHKIIFCGSSVAAKDSNSSRGQEIIICNIQEAIEKSNEFIKFKEKIESESKAAKEKFEQREMKLREEYAELNSKSSILSQEVMQEKVAKLQQEAMKLQEEANKKGIEMQEKATTAGLYLRNEVVEIIKKHYSDKLTIDGVAVLYSGGTKDVTMDVLGKLNEVMRKKKVDLWNLPTAKQKDSSGK